MVTQKGESPESANSRGNNGALRSAETTSSVAGVSTPVNTPIDRILQLLPGHKRNGKGWEAKCPAHDDRRASLSVSEGEGGKVVLHCFAGCSVQKIAGAIGLSVRDLFPPKERPAPTRSPSRSHIAATYDYTDAGGKLLFQAVRYEPKDFRQRRPDGRGGWIWDLKGVSKVPYRLPRVLEAVKAKRPVYIVEGEKDVDTLESWGLTATTNAGGAGKWLKSYSSFLKGVSVIILPDNDPPGREHAEGIARSLHGLAAAIRIVELPDLPSKGDISDWARAGGTAEALHTLVKAAADWGPQTRAEADASTFPYTDAGNAERLVAAHGRDLRYDIDSGKWLVWTGSYWKPDLVFHINRLALGEVRSLYAELPGLGHDDAQELLRFIKKSEGESRLNAMISLARTLKGTAIQSKDIDADPLLLNVQNGTLDLRSGELREHRQSDLISRISPVEYQPNAQCPRWMQFLSEVFMDQQDLISFAQRMCGYWLTGLTKYEAMFVFFGKGRNGKGKFCDTMAYILGDMAQDAPVSTITERRESSGFDLPMLAHARLVTCTESSYNDAINEPLLKKLTGSDKVTCCFKFRDYFTYEPKFKIVLYTNEFPRIRSQNEAMKQRLILLPFRQTFHAPESGNTPVRDPDLLTKLKAEAPGILRWAVEGWLQVQAKDTLDIPRVIRREVATLFDDQDPLGEFLHSECILGPQTEVAVKRLWDHYQKWCGDRGEKLAYKNPSWFSRALIQRDGVDCYRTNSGRYLTGVKLLGDTDGSGRLALDGDTSDTKTVFSETYPHEGESKARIPKQRYDVTDVTAERDDPAQESEDDGFDPFAEDAKSTDADPAAPISRADVDGGSGNGNGQRQRPARPPVSKPKIRCWKCNGRQWWRGPGDIQFRCRNCDPPVLEAMVLESAIVEEAAVDA